MDDTALRNALAELETERAVKQEEVAKLAKGVNALRSILGIDEAASGITVAAIHADLAKSVTVSADRGAPRGQEAVLAILQETPGQWLEINALTETMVDRGWVETSRDPREAVRTSADRLVRNDPHVEKRRGIYRYEPDPDPHDERGGERDEAANS